MTISGGQILHKAGYPRITFPRIQKWEPALRKFLSSFFLLQELLAFRKRTSENAF